MTACRGPRAQSYPELPPVDPGVSHSDFPKGRCYPPEG
jgi:hypothetical protein